MIPDTSAEAGQREASVILARLCGWEYFCDGMTSGIWQITPGGLGDMLFYDEWQRPQYDGDDYGIVPLNLYDPANMALAWRVLNWANATRFGGGTTLDQWKWWHDFIADLRLLRASDAQMAWLDKILQLAIEAGMCGHEGGAWYIDLRLLRQKEE